MDQIKQNIVYRWVFGIVIVSLFAIIINYILQHGPKDKTKIRTKIERSYVSSLLSNKKAPPPLVHFMTNSS